MTDMKRRLAQRQDELDWLYMELYDDRIRLRELKTSMARAYQERNQSLRRLDKKREADPAWFREGKMLGITMYPGLFAGNLRGVEEKLGYLKEQGITYVHLMPLLKMPHPDNDGGYAVEDFNQVDPALGTNEDLARLSAAMRRQGMSLCLDFVINHTADTHEWAMRAKAGEQEYIDRYICFDTPDIPREMEKTIPDVFPETAPGSYARGERYNYNPVTLDARTCGTTASLCGIEKGLFEGSEEQEVWLDAVEGEFTDLISGEACSCAHRTVNPYQYCLCLRNNQCSE